MSKNKIRLPKKGMGKEEIIQQMENLRKDDADWRAGRTWSLVYHASDKHKEILKKAHNMFFSENGLSPMAFPSLKQFQAEVVAMTIDLLRGGRKCVGTMTGGGTESNAMAVKTYRDWAMAEKPEIKDPEMIMPVSAHPSLDKGAHYFNVKTVHVPLNDDFTVDVKAMEDAITENTILMVGSAPEYPKGMIDPIPELAGIAKEKNLGFHVDSCLGGYILPFLRKLEYPITDFDFKVPGVTSISADIHKYGFAAKGASVLMFNSEKIRKYLFYAYVDWPGGIYASPAFRGTTPGGPIAAAWASMMALGEEGYLSLAKSMMETTKKLRDGINAIPELHVMGRPAMTAFAFTSDKLNIYAVADLLLQKGWHLDSLQLPPCLHMMINPGHSKVADDFLNDLQTAVREVSLNPSKSPEGAAAIYGMAGTISDRKVVKDMALRFLADQYRLK
ncbi:MAG: pyridoxal phosphate-dependent decarboxylase family protein [Promethearchaeota archaeon]